MDKLPAELLSNIFVYLYFCEKQECMLVCRLWLNFIHPTTLPDTVHITGESAIRGLGQDLDSQRSNKAQIKDLVIHSVDLNEEVLGSYQECFPKARSLYLEDCYYTGSLSEQHTQRKKQLMSWFAEVEVLELHGSLPLDKCLMSGGAYSALKTLVVTPANIKDIDTLVNAPNLTRLTLRNICISISCLEKIHSNLLFLKSLELENIYLGPPNAFGTTLKLVTPSEVITTLLITTYHDDPNFKIDLIQKWLRYIRRKYTNLVEFRFLIGGQKPVSNLNEEIIFNREMLPLIKHIGSKARFVEIDCCNMLSRLFELMNSTGFQAGCLKLSSTCSTLKKYHPLYSDLIHFIRELTLNVNSSRWITDFSSLMRSIETLNIKTNHNFEYHGFKLHSTVCLQKILGSCSNSLSTLRIKKFGVDAPPSIHQSYSLTKLQILSPCISPEACSFIAWSLPNLRYLELGFLKVKNPNTGEFYFNVYSLSETMNRNIELGSLNLYRLDLHVEHHTYIKIKTNTDNRTRSFCTLRNSMSGMNWKVANHRCVWGTLDQTAYEEAMAYSHEKLYLEFNSVQLLFINNMVAH